MDIKIFKTKVSGFFKKYRYVVLVVLVGFILMSIPEIGESNKYETKQLQLSEEKEIPLDEQLSTLLSKIEGAGRVEVILTIAEGEKIQYQTNNNISITNDNQTTQSDTVTVTDTERNQSGLITQRIPPKFRGAIVVCQGADSPTVRLAITDAVAKVTGLGTDNISVLKMK